MLSLLNKLTVMSNKNLQLSRTLRSTAERFMHFMTKGSLTSEDSPDLPFKSTPIVYNWILTTFLMTDSVNDKVSLNLAP